MHKSTVAAGDKLAMHKLGQAVEKAKVGLSSSASVRVEVADLAGGHRLSETL